MRSIQGAVLFVVIMLVTCLFPAYVLAQNPSFGGKEFRRVWVGGSLPQGALEIPRFSSGSKVYLVCWCEPFPVWFFSMVFDGKYLENDWFEIRSRCMQKLLRAK